MRERHDELRFWASYSGLAGIVGTALGIIWGIVSAMRGVRVDILDYLIVLTALMLGLATGVICAASLVLEDGR